MITDAKPTGFEATGDDSAPARMFIPFEEGLLAALAAGTDVPLGSLVPFDRHYDCFRWAIVRDDELVAAPA